MFLILIEIFLAQITMHGEVAQLPPLIRKGIYVTIAISDQRLVTISTVIKLKNKNY